MTKIYYKVVEGELLFVPICAVLYQGRLGRDLTVTLVILNSSLGDTGMHLLCKICPTCIFAFI